MVIGACFQLFSKALNVFKCFALLLKGFYSFSYVFHLLLLFTVSGRARPNAAKAGPSRHGDKIGGVELGWLGWGGMGRAIKFEGNVIQIPQIIKKLHKNCNCHKSTYVTIFQKLCFR
jgi:hypothetical protein